MFDSRPSGYASWVLFNGYSALVLGAVLLLALSRVNQLVPASQKHHVAVYTQPEKVCAQLPKGRVFTLGYSSQAVLSYHCQNDEIHVFMSTSKFGREDDKKTNFKAMDGQALTLFVPHKKSLKITTVFSSLQLSHLRWVRGSRIIG